MSDKYRKSDVSQHTFLKLLCRIKKQYPLSIEIDHVGDAVEIISSEDRDSVLGEELEAIFFKDWYNFSEAIKKAISADQEVEIEQYFEGFGKYLRIYINPLLDQLLEFNIVDFTSFYQSINAAQRRERHHRGMTSIYSMLLDKGDVSSVVNSAQNILEENFGFYKTRFLFEDESLKQYTTVERSGTTFPCIEKLKRRGDVIFHTRKTEYCRNCEFFSDSSSACLLIPMQAYQDFLGALILSDSKEQLYDIERLDSVKSLSNHLSQFFFNHLQQNNSGHLQKRLDDYSNQLSERNSELEYKNKHLKILNEELQKALRKAEESEHMKAVFLANMSHEIRTPLNGIIGFAQLLKNALDGCNEKLENYTDIIMDSSSQLVKTINNVITYSKISSDTAVHQQMECSLNKELDKVFPDSLYFSLKRKQKPIDFKKSYDLAPGEDSLKLDIVNVKEVIVNLLDNAYKFTEKGEIELFYKLDQNYIVFGIRDTGVGISPEEKQKIFNNFSQADDSLTREYGGLGLGLSIVSSLLSDMNGQIWVQSIKNKGTLIYFTVPYHIPESNQHLKDNRAKLPRQSIKKLLNTEILVIDSDPSNSTYLQQILDEYYYVTIKEKVSAALEYMESTDRDIKLVYMDARLPDMHIFDAVPKVRKILPDIPVISQVSATVEKDEENSFLAGCNDILSKPFSEEDMINKVKQFI
ncbi:MAG: ATP-binding protein [Bacteroidales bacterium]